MASTPAAPVPAVDQDAADLARYGYKQELKRSLNVFSSFAVAFSYISPATGIFTLFILGSGFLAGSLLLDLAGGMARPVPRRAGVRGGARAHFPLAGSVFQWTKYLTRNKTYAWYAGWIYLWAGALTVAAVVATLPLALIPMIDNLGIHAIKMNPADLTNQKWIAAITLIVITLLNIFGVRLVALINNTGRAVRDPRPVRVRHHPGGVQPPPLGRRDLRHGRGGIHRAATSWWRCSWGCS